MAMFGKNWLEDSEDDFEPINIFSHWKEDEDEEDFSLFSRWKDNKEDDDYEPIIKHFQD